VMDNKTKYYKDMEARYRKRADDEPMKREQYLADADAWRLLADTRRYVAAKQIEMRDALASFEKSKNDSGLG
jgi:hypothetical protein